MLLRVVVVVEGVMVDAEAQEGETVFGQGFCLEVLFS